MWIIKSQRKKCTFNKILEFQAIKKNNKVKKKINFFLENNLSFSLTLLFK